MERERERENLEPSRRRMEKKHCLDQRKMRKKMKRGDERFLGIPSLCLKLGIIRDFVKERKS